MDKKGFICEYGAKYALLYIVGEGGTSTSNTQTRYLILSSTPVSLLGAGYTEPTAPSYVRMKIGASGYSGYDTADYFSEVKTRTNKDGNITKWYITNKTEIHFLEAQESWGTLSYWAITDSANINTGNVLFAGELKTPISPIANSIPIVRANKIQIFIPTEYYVAEEDEDFADETTTS
ncbi:MAG: hypothetical protein ACI35W_03995 [Anaeroplasmataceae bacterium]